ncbi:MAG: hypothetical protein LC659_03630, partial [Myxococcales bacterium]|nr:hypothetical protein [Myxococcales bacterium]
SVYAALHNRKENADFLRPDALLTVVFVTNEDDGSAAPGAKFYEQAGSDPSGGGMYGQYTTYRQTRFAVDCGGMPIPYGMPISSLTNCAAAPNPMAADVNSAYDISRYTDYFTKEARFGGVKDNPNDVILVGIDGPESHVETTLVDPSKGNTPYVACPSPMLSSSCIEALQHSCENTVQPGFFGDPAVRLNAVISQAPNQNFQIASICGDDLNQTPNFTTALQKVAELISMHFKPACLDAPIASRDDGTPDCVVEDVTSDPSGGPDTIVVIPSCAENGHVTPCWQYNDLLAQYQSQGCVAPPTKPPASCMLPQSCQPVTNPVDGKEQLASVSIDRGGQLPPKNTSVSVFCATIASSSQ